MKTDPRQMTFKHQRKDHHMFNTIAYKNRVGGNHLEGNCPQENINTCHFSAFIPSVNQVDKMIQESAILVGHILAKHITSLSWIKDVLPEFITHENINQTKTKTERVHLGLMHKNENKLDEMQIIVKELHRYSPGHMNYDEEDDHKPIKITSGGDYLTFERHKSAQQLHVDGRNASKRLEGLIPNMELFHHQAEWNLVIWKLLCKGNSHKDIGTLFAARNAINARNVTTDPHNNFYAADELLTKYSEAYFVAGALEYFGMQDSEDQPTINCFDLQNRNMENVVKVISKFIQEYFTFDIPEIDQSAPVNLELQCRVCGKEYRKGPGIVKRHEKQVHNFPENENTQSHDSSPTPDSTDFILNYTKNAITLLILRLNMNDAIHLGDGERIYRNFQLMYLHFKVTGCHKYAHGSLETLAQIKCLLSPRLSYRLKWNRTVNTSGNVMGNYPKDLDVEHDNKIVKRDLKAFRGVITEKTTERISRSVDVTDKITKKMDKITGARKPSGKHQKINTNDDVAILYKQFHKAKLFQHHPGRAHSAFPNIEACPLTKLEPSKLKDWYYNTLQDVSERHFYNY